MTLQGSVNVHLKTKNSTPLNEKEIELRLQGGLSIKYNNVCYLACGPCQGKDQSGSEDTALGCSTGILSAPHGKY